MAGQRYERVGRQVDPVLPATDLCQRRYQRTRRRTGCIGAKRVHMPHNVVTQGLTRQRLQHRVEIPADQHVRKDKT